MDKIYVVAHTHWDFEWYFSRYEARVQFMYHMDEVLAALENNQLMYYTLDGQMSIIDDYLETCPEKKAELEKFVKAKRLFIGPWYTQIDEMVTSGEAIVHNLQQGIRKAEALGNVMKIGYLPDSFGQCQDMPKIYQGFGIQNAIFWRGMPPELKERYFNWLSEDGSHVLVANLKNGYYVGSEWMEGNDIYEKLTRNTKSDIHLLPVGGDQRAVDRDLKEKISSLNTSEDITYQESNYCQFFDELVKNKHNLPTYHGEFVEPTDSKIHRGIYSSRADLKQLYDALERQMVYEVQPLIVIAKRYGIDAKVNTCAYLWETIARGQAHDSSGACNSDKTNRAIYQRGIDAKQMSQSLVDYLTRKLGEATDEYDVTIWNTSLRNLKTVKEIIISTKEKNFSLQTKDNQDIPYEIIEQKMENAAPLRRKIEERLTEEYWVTKIAIAVDIAPMTFMGLRVCENGQGVKLAVNDEVDTVENEYYQIAFHNKQLNIFDKQNKQKYENVLTFEDGGDEGDNYDYSPPFEDWIINLDFQNAQVKCTNSALQSVMTIEGVWNMPSDLAARQNKEKNACLPYKMEIKLKDEDKLIYYKVRIDNEAVKDHRLRMVFKTNINTDIATADTPFGIIERPMNDQHLADWQEIGYKEEPTSLRPLLHYVNVHDDMKSFSILTNGTKTYQLLNNHDIALTLFRSVGYLGRPDLKRRPGDASGIQYRYVETPDSQLAKEMEFTGAFVIENKFNPCELQTDHQQMQEAIYHHKQNINRFTTPLQYFQSLPIAEKIKEDSFVQLKAADLVASNIEMTNDLTGYTIRLYNPTKKVLEQPGQLVFNQKVSIQQVDLNDKPVTFVGDNFEQFEIPQFEPGEIRTYAIYS